jgi:hypothetical protein
MSHGDVGVQGWMKSGGAALAALAYKKIGFHKYDS